MNKVILTFALALLASGCASNRTSGLRDFGSVGVLPLAQAQRLSNGIAQNPAVAVAIGKCRDGLSSEEYGCAPGAMCPSMMNDVREMVGFHTISVSTALDGWKYVHVADTCSHYFCSIDPDCVKKGGSETACMVSRGCMIVSKFEKK